MGDIMSYKLYAVNESIYNLFKNKEDLYIELIKKNDTQSKQLYCQLDSQSLADAILKSYNDVDKIDNYSFKLYNYNLCKYETIRIYSDYIVLDSIIESKIISFLLRENYIWFICKDKEFIRWQKLL